MDSDVVERSLERKKEEGRKEKIEQGNVVENGWELYDDSGILEVREKE